MNAKILLMTALLGGVSVLSFAGCSSDDDTKNTDDNKKDDKDAGSTDKDSGGGSTDKDSGGGQTIDCGSSSCAKACEKAVAAGCGDAESIVEVCNQANTGKAIAPSCADKIDAAIACFNDKATYTCESGATKPSGCETEYGEAGACVQAALSPDAGSDAGN